jgi:signal transduction histidine kinase/ligand-binding sensor domain-containing protein
LKKTLTLIFICSVHWVNAQSLNLSFNHLNREGGLSNNNAFSMIADAKSFLWIGTFNGLNRFDGSNCRNYKPYNSTIRGLNFGNLVEDQQGDLWTSSESGLNHYSRQTDSFEEIDCFKDGKPHAYNPFYVDNQNRIWLIVIGEGIIAYQPKEKTFKRISTKIVDFAKVSNIPFQKVKQVFYTTSQSGLNILSIKDDKELELKTFFDGKTQPALNLLRYFFVENDSLVWLTNNNKGLIKFNFQNQQFQAFDTFQNKNIINLTTAAFRPNSSQIFIGSNKFGVLIFDTKTSKFTQQLKHVATNPQSLQSNWAEDVVIDKNQNLFVNILGSGIDFTNLNASNTQQWLRKEDVKENGVEENDVSYSFISKSKIYVKLQQGQTFLLDFDGNVLKKGEDKTGVAFIVRSSDNILYSCQYGSVAILDEEFVEKQRIVIDPKTIVKSQFRSITEVSPNEFILANDKGLYSLKKNGIQYTIELIEGLKSPDFEIINLVYFDKKTQQLFISSKWWNYFNMAKKVKGKWILMPKERINASIFNIANDIWDSNKVWFCSNKGLLRFDTRTHNYDIWDEAKGLPDNSVTTMLPEKNGDFWLITNRGISFYNHQSKEFKNFSHKDGATSSEYDWYVKPYLPDGRIMFGGTDGITVIDPKKSNTNTIPILYITDIKVNEKSVVTTDYIGESSSINLKAYENSFSVDFVGIEYAKPERIKLQYQLQGFDNQWISVKNPANVHFSNVPDNDYIFKIRALSDNGTVAAERSLKISIATPFWRTWWFRLLVFALLAGLAYAFYRYRINQLLEMQAVRNRISTDLHDEIGATLSGIGILSTIAKQQVEESHPANALLGRITDDALTVGNAIDDIVWSINPKNDELSNVVARMSRHAAELFDAKGIDYQIITPENTDDIKLSMEERRDVYLIFKEAINNLLKYAQCTKVRIEMNVENRKFKLHIADNGVGFDTTKISNRNGIMNMKNRALKLKGNFQINSKLGEGTKVELEFSI